MFENDLYKDFKLLRKKPLNLIHNLIGRELGTHSSLLGVCSTFSECSNKNELTVYNHARHIYLCVTPNYSVIHVKTPNCYLKRFSPDGKYLISFNQNSDGIQIFLFNGPSAGIEHINAFISSCRFNDKTDFENVDSNSFRLNAFEIYFKEVCTLKLTDNNETMNRECILFFDDSYLIVGSSEIISDENLPSYAELAPNNEAVHYSLIENYTIYLVNIRKHKLCDKLRFKAEKLDLIHNQSFSLFNNTLLVLSIQNQSIYVYKLLKQHSEEHYKFVQVQTIGRFCFDNDQELLESPRLFASRSSQSSCDLATKSRLTRRANFAQRFNSTSQTKAFAEPFFTSLKQRIISFFYKQAQETNSLNEFYLSLNSLINLKMYKIQLLDERHLLIKYVNVDLIRNRSNKRPIPFNLDDTATQQTNHLSAANMFQQNNVLISINQNDSCCYVLYDIKTATILNAIRNISKLEKTIEDFWDYVALSSAANESNLTKFYSNQIRFRKNSELIKFVMSQMPMSPQSFTSTPYLDQTLFSYDEKLISNFERAKPIGDQVIRFSNQESGRICFRLYPGKQSISEITTVNSFYQSFNRLVAFIWHPTQPFCISVQRNSQEYSVNFHVYFKSN